ncbi:MAG: hypothetical protein SRB1_02708 [Desulfobacteraceae bacterium Eth-SRB1]|nr:MAG: hypothetical protein SRB1_02708 [Desulfobacteraceae bacterium Eth-SRB1]
MSPPCPQRNCPIKNVLISTRNVVKCHPIPAERRIQMTKGTGMCTARNQGRENFLTPARQKPNGRFRSKTERATIHKSCITSIVSQPSQMAFKAGFIFEKDRLILELSIDGIALHSLNV